MSVLHAEPQGRRGGRVLLLAGSLGTDLGMWDGQAPLAAALRLVPLDLRGHGRSPVPAPPYTIAELGADVLETMDARQIERASFCGLSLGGMVGMWLAAHAPDRIERLVLICTSAHLGPPQRWRDRISAVTEAGTVEPIADTVVAGWLTPRFAEAHPEVRARLRGMLVACDPDGYAGCCSAVETMDLRGDLPRVIAPTLVVSGAEDPATPVEHQQLIARGIPGARHATVAPAAHLAAVERAGEVNRLIEEHLS